MTAHLSARLAWHDTGWNGRVCRDPAGNVFCSGQRSLLSERIAREKKLERETSDDLIGEPLDKQLADGYLPPCYWSSAALSDRPLKVLHRHGFASLKHRTIPDTLPPQSLFTWPFRLSYTHAGGTKASHGDYWPDLDDRIDAFVAGFEPGRSLVFLYLNHDNPVSADDEAFALIGCAPLVGMARTGAYDLSEEELARERRRRGKQYFQTGNWALRVTHDLAGHGVALPYRQYLEHVAAHPGAESLLDEVKVLVDEPSLVNRFKYVAE